MSDARWIDVLDDVAAAREHFANALALRAAGEFDEPGLAGYRDRMALMHALQLGHTSAESALIRIMRVLGEELPTGEDWHQTLINRLAKPRNGSRARPALLSPNVTADLHETRRFRNRAMRSYGAFDVSKARASLEAAGRLRTTFEHDVVRFKEIIDPE